METLLVTRTLDAPRQEVFDAWTQPARLSRWFAPPGFVLHDCTMELTQGGMLHYGMRAPNGVQMWGKWIFAAISSPESLVCTVMFSDEAGGDTRHPWQAGWPMRTLSTLTLGEHESRTLLTLEWAPQDASFEEEQLFIMSMAGMRQVWIGTLNQLGIYLASVGNFAGNGHAA